ncbi:MAG: tryptophan 7-halogenase [Deltaproteobacteria bacterium]|nr:tryptophan 7-halogenase [Deltaproteobacteria bacterium]
MSGIKERIESLPEEKRQLLQRRLQRKASSPSSSLREESPSAEESFDVVVLGGGLAGLSLALEISQRRPETRLLVAERRKHPFPEAAHKVGESTVEVGSRYFRDVLGLEEHLREEQLPKAGLRFFFSSGNNDDITDRVEIGATYLPPVGSYQLDRGRFENFLSEEARQHGVEVRDGCRVRQVQLAEDGERHRVNLTRGGTESCVEARWVVDASGRNGLLKRQLQLGRKVAHRCHAAWFRLAAVIDPDDWSSDSTWRQRVPPGLRRLSTNHLMGPGYWVWLIPLASGATSVGIVVDAQVHSLDDLRSFEKAQRWLQNHEPECANHVAAQQDSLMDFRVFPDYAYSCERVYSPQRWCLTGEAGVFADPFYSPGSDFIGIGNSFITDLVCRDLGGEEVSERAETYNRIYLNTFESLLTVYQDLYPVMGNAQVMTAKIIWDFAIYWGFSGLLIFNDKLRDPAFMASMGPELQRHNQLNVLLQRLFLDWNRLEQKPFRRRFIDFLEIDFLRRLHHDLETPLPDESLQRKVRENLNLLEALASGIFQRASKALPESQRHQAVPPGSDPYRIALNETGWVAAGGSAPDAEMDLDLSKIWLDNPTEIDGQQASPSLQGVGA